MARNGAQLSDAVTIYTNGSTKRAEAFEAATVAKEPFKADSRRIKKFELGPTGTGVLITFEDGSTRSEGFLACKPVMRLRNGYLAEQLGLDTTPQGDIKVIPPFGETSVPGVFAAGDNSSTFKMVSNAIHSGALAASGVASHVQSRLYGTTGMSDMLRKAAAAAAEKK
jgi:gliotoxin/aspirochlorine biosynthesis thioredoxin reductase